MPVKLVALAGVAPRAGPDSVRLLDGQVEWPKGVAAGAEHLDCQRIPADSELICDIKLISGLRQQVRLLVIGGDLYRRAREVGHIQ